jgi:acyl carrier protein
MNEHGLNNDRLKTLPESVQSAFLRFRTTGDPVAFRPVLHHLVTDFKPEWTEVSPDSLTDDLHLIDDLSFDSLAITEMVFFFEDLMGISITNADLQSLITVGDLRLYLYKHLQPS